MSKLLAGRYELVDKIGEGGMAIVYRAKDRLLNRYVAIKILRPEYTRDEQFIESFRRESQAAAGLQHPNIVAVYDVGKSGNINYIVMELVDGRPLSEIIEKEAPMEPRLVISIAKQVASALALAHRHQIIHRDVKPHNILINTDGVAKLTDFGIAKAVSNSSSMADTSKIIGSVHYFSPEQARGSYVDERSDIYSLGIVMYEMLTGRVPFDGENPVEVALKHINEEIIPPSKLMKGIPPNLEKLVMKATDKFQTNRYKSAEELLEDLNNVEFVTNYFNSGLHIAVENANRINSTGIKSEPVDEGEFDNIAKGKIAESRTGGYGSDGNNGNNGNRGGGFLSKTWIKVLIMIIALLIAALLFLGALRSMGLIGASDEIKVPDLTNKTYEEAMTELNELGLIIQRGDDVSSDNIEVGKIVQQMPVSGSNVKEGKTITVRISSGPGEISVPDLKNRTIEEATQILEEQGLKISRGDDVYSKTIEAGKVVSQEPAAKSSAKKGETIVVHLSKGEEITTTSVPNLLGYTYTSRDEMDTYLATFNLKLGEVYEVESAMTPSSIVEQSPAGGNEVAKDSYIDIGIAVEPQVKTASVPSLTGRTMNEATLICEERGLKIVLGDLVEDPTGTGVAGTILRQDIEPGAEVEEGTTITVYVIKEPEPAPEPEPVPDPDPVPEPTEPTETDET